MTTTNDFTIGTEIYYTGDQANHDGFGTIVRIRPATQYNNTCVDVLMADGREFKVLPLCTFAPGPGTRFILAAEHRAARAARMAEMVAYLEARKSA